MITQIRNVNVAVETVNNHLKDEEEMLLMNQVNRNAAANANNEPNFAYNAPNKVK